MWDQVFGTASRALLEGRHVEIRGGSGTGKSTLLERLGEYLLNRTWTVVRVDGVPEFRGVPLGVLQSDGGPGQNSRGSAVRRAVDEFAEGLRSEACVLVDDWDALDELSRGVIRTAVAQASASIAVTRSGPRNGSNDPVGIDFAYSADLGPVRFDELEAVLRARMGGPLEPSTMSRLFAKSGGVVGFALALADAGVREERIVLVRNRWTAVRHLWSPSLSASVEARLRGLDDGSVDALATLALLGVVDDVTARALIPQQLLEALEGRGLVSLYPSGGRMYVSVTPALIADYLRETTARSRLSRLSETAGARLQAHETAMQDDTHARVGDAVFVRLVQEKHRISRAVALDAFHSGVDATAAAEWVETLVKTDSSAEEIDEAITRAAQNVSNGDERVRLAVLRAENLAYGHDDVAGSSRVLDETRCETAEQEAMVAVGRAGIALMCDLSPSLEDIPSPDDEELSLETRAASARLRAAMLTSLTRFTESDAMLDYAHDTLGATDSYLSMISVLNAVAMGDVERALRVSRRGFDEAMTELDVESLRRHGYALVVALLEQGTYAEADTVLDRVLMLGEPGSRPRHEFFGLMSMGAIMADRRLFRSAATDFRRHLDGIDLPQGPFPGMGKSWALARGVTVGPEADDAAEALQLAAAEYERRGHVWLGRWARLLAIELSRSPAWLEEATAQSVDAGPALDAYERYVAALVLGQPSALIAAGDALSENGRYGLALTTYSEAERLADERGDAVAEAEGQERFAALAARLPLGEYDTSRFVVGISELSERETEISVLAAAGMSNKQIADQLVLSVRTVESHLNRALHKLGLSSRSQLTRYLPRP